MSQSKDNKDVYIKILTILLAFDMLNTFKKLFLTLSLLKRKGLWPL